MMEEWEMELEFLTWDAHEAAVRRYNGTENVEEVEVSEEDFKADLNDFGDKIGDKFDPSQWEEVDG